MPETVEIQKPCVYCGYFLCISMISLTYKLGTLADIAMY